MTEARQPLGQDRSSFSKRDENEFCHVSSFFSKQSLTSSRIDAFHLANWAEQRRYPAQNTLGNLSELFWILLYQTKFGMQLYTYPINCTETNSGWYKISRRSVITIQIWFVIIRFRKDFATRISATSFSSNVEFFGIGKNWIFFPELEKLQRSGIQLSEKLAGLDIMGDLMEGLP